MAGVEYADGRRVGELRRTFPARWGFPPLDEAERHQWIAEHARADAASAEFRAESRAFWAAIDNMSILQRQVRLRELEMRV
jgi:hypothetical protein